MRALVVREHGGFEALRIEERPRPGIRPEEVLVRIHAAGLNHLDLWVRRGVEGHRFPLPLVLGCDGAGVVEEVGAAAGGVAVGDRVAISPGFAPPEAPESLAGRHHLAREYGIFGETRDGTCAELCAVPARNLLHMPAGLGFPEAAAFPLAALTAWHMLVERGRVRAGMDVLIHAAGSGVSIYAIQIARLLGARVIATTTAPSKVERALELGADAVILLGAEDFPARVREFTGKRGVDVVIDHVGAATFGLSLRALRKGGAVVTCGATSGPRLEADLRLIFFKSLSILGSTMGGMGEMAEVWSLFTGGRLRAVVDRVLPLESAREAHRALEAREVFGKVVLVPGDP
jgi:NADPH:quinone reductase-like Zn-dependent oxidoreductase